MVSAPNLLNGGQLRFLPVRPYAIEVRAHRGAGVLTVAEVVNGRIRVTAYVPVF